MDGQQFQPPVTEAQGKPKGFMLPFMIFSIVIICVGTYLELFYSSYQCQRGDECWGGIEIFAIPIFIYIAFIIGKFINQRIGSALTRWIIAVILFASFIWLMDGQGFMSWLPESRAEKSFAQEVARLPYMNNTSECSSLVRDFWRKGAPYDWQDYKPWKECIRQTVKTDEDVLTCEQQAGNNTYNLGTKLVNYCAVRN